MFFAQGLCFFFAITLLHAANTVLSFQSDTSISGTLIPFSIILPNLCVSLLPHQSPSDPSRLTLLDQACRL